MTRKQPRSTSWRTTQPERCPTFCAVSVLLFLFVTISESTSVVTGVGELGNATVSCPIEANNDAPLLDTGSLVDDLLKWCSQDTLCSRVYHQDRRKNATVFRHLLEPLLSTTGASAGIGTETSYYGPLRELLCKGHSVDELNRMLWVQFITAKRDASHPMCDVNHDIVFRDNDLRFECACKSDRICNESIYDLIPFYVVLALIALLTVLFFVTKIVLAIKQMKTLDKITGRKGEGLTALSKTLG